MSLNAAERATLAHLADVLIPAGDGFPSASKAGVAHEQVDQLLDARPDLLSPLKQLLAEIANPSTAETLEKLRVDRPAAWRVLTEVVPGAYFLNPDIRAKLGYTGQNPRPMDPSSDYEDLLQSVRDRGTIYRPTFRAGAAYDWRKSYEWNFDHVPDPLLEEAPSLAGTYTCAGLAVSSPLGIAAGPLLNGAWILYYASLGFDVLTYKTVRSRARACYPLPNLQPIAFPANPTGLPIPAPLSAVADSTGMRGSWAVSFGMPSKEPAFWRADIEKTREALPKTKLLSVSVVATPEPRWSLEDLAADYAQCARWAVESGADCIEANFSCPNVITADAQLYQQTSQAAAVARAIRAVIGGRPLLIKVGHVIHEAQATELCRALAPYADALVMVNCVSANVINLNGQPLFGGEKRGIAGAAIRGAALEQIRLFASVIQQQKLKLQLIGVGGIGCANDVRAHLQAGAVGVQLATAAMINPRLGLSIRCELARGDAAAR